VRPAQARHELDRRHAVVAKARVEHGDGREMPGDRRGGGGDRRLGRDGDDSDALERGHERREARRLTVEQDGGTTVVVGRRRRTVSGRDGRVDRSGHVISLSDEGQGVRVRTDSGSGRSARGNVRGASLSPARADHAVVVPYRPQCGSSRRPWTAAQGLLLPVDATSSSQKAVSTPLGWFVSGARGGETSEEVWDGGSSNGVRTTSTPPSHTTSKSGQSDLQLHHPIE
jgi:hypothetical protein